MKYFLVSCWVATILIAGAWSLAHLPFTPNFPYYTTDLAPHYSRAVASFAHFDGIHYLRLMKKGYDDTGSQAFFPVYPLLMRSLTFGYFDPLFVAIFVNASLLIATLYIVTRSLTKTKQRKFLLLFLTFPTSFFLLANYTESLFILLVVLCFKAVSNKRFLLAATLAALASGTRVVGIFLAVALITAMWQAHRSWKAIGFYGLLAGSGLLCYMGYLGWHFHDPLMFVHVQTLFGAGRSGGQIIMLPQVLYRYVRILAAASWRSLSAWRSAWELGTFLLAMWGLYVTRRSLNLPAFIYCLGVLLLPTLSGTLSSYGRYTLVALPLFIAAAEVLPWRVVGLLSLLQYGMLTVGVALFVQGIFIA